MDAVLAQVRDFADRAHGGQLRRYTPERYIVHPVRVMERCAEAGATRAQLAAALLHDVLEDTTVDEEQLLRFLRTVMDPEEAAHTLQLVVELTDVYTTAAYPKWKRRRRKEAETERMALTSAEAQTVKYADILDNAREIVRHDPNFAPKFLHECRQALRVMTKGHAALRAEALQVLRAGLDALPPRRKRSNENHKNENHMHPDPNEKNPKALPEDGSREELNLTRRDASLGPTGERRETDAPSMSDQAGADPVNGNLSQSGSSTGERNPEYGDAADPTFEAM